MRYSEHREHQSEDDDDERAYSGGIAKEEIRIPNPGPRKISRVEQVLASIMSGGERQMHGLTGKPLVYVQLINRSPDILEGTPNLTLIAGTLPVFLYL